MALATALITTTLLARELQLEEFGLYGLVVSFLAYIAFAISSAEAAAVRGIAALDEGPGRNRMFTAALLVYAVLGVGAGLVLAAGGAILVGLLGFSDELVHTGRQASVAVGVVTAVGWPLKAFHAVLRADQRFGTASATEAMGQVLLLVSMVLVLVLDGALWLLIAVGSSVPLFMGICALPAVVFGPSVVALAPRGIRRDDLRQLATASFGMFGVGASDVVVTSLDRVVLGAFRSAASLGLYEAAIRPNNVIRSATSAFSVTLLPVISRLETHEGGLLQRTLVLRGTRYMLAAVVPPTAALIALSEPVLTTWLGPRYSDAWVACAIFLAWWLVASNASIAETTMFVDGQLRRLVKLSWSVAVVNLVLSLALTPLLGLEGVALGTTLGYMAVLPFWVRYALQRFDITVGELARAAWVPAYSAGAIAAAVALLARLTLPLDNAVTVLAVLGVAVAAGWAVIFAGFFSAEERPAGARRSRPLARRLAQTQVDGAGLGLGQDRHRLPGLHVLRSARGAAGRRTGTTRCAPVERAPPGAGRASARTRAPAPPTGRGAGAPADRARCSAGRRTPCRRPPGLALPYRRSSTYRSPPAGETSVVSSSTPPGRSTLHISAIARESRRRGCARSPRCRCSGRSSRRGRASRWRRRPRAAGPGRPRASPRSRAVNRSTAGPVAAALALQPAGQQLRARHVQARTVEPAGRPPGPARSSATGPSAPAAAGARRGRRASAGLRERASATPSR